MEIIREKKSLDFHEAKQLASGIFWVLSDDHNLKNFKFLMFEIPCDRFGVPENTHSIKLNSKSGTTYNHKLIWESEIKNNRKYYPHSKKEYNYYPRGRVEIANNNAIIYLNPHINTPVFISRIKREFGLNSHNIKTVNVHSDGSTHYRCFLDNL